jgi:hypothetical protein
LFGHQHYVPVMRTKPAELRALRALDSVPRSRTTPILEYPPRVLRGCDTLARLEQRLDYVVAHLANWAGRSVFIDFNMRRSSDPEAVEIMAARTVGVDIAYERCGNLPDPVVLLIMGVAAQLVARLNRVRTTATTATRWH